MNKSILPLSLALGLFACSSVPLKKEQRDLPFIGDIKIQRFVLENGLTLLVAEDHSSPTFAIQTWFDVGSKNEELGKTGLAHLFEHMMFKQTKNLKPGEFDATLEQAGAKGLNAFTSRDYTAYIVELPKDKLELVLRLEADRMVNLVVDDKAFKTETEVVQNERRFRNENSPDGTLYQTLFELAFKKHPYRWPVIGYEQDLADMNAQDALEFYKKYYQPDRATIVVVGDVKTSRVLELVGKYYGDIPARKAALEAPPLPSEDEQKSPRRRRLKLNVQVDKIWMGYPIPHLDHPDTPALYLLSAILSDGRSGRLKRSMINTGIASAVESGHFENEENSLFVVYADAQKGKRATQIDALVRRELKKLSQELVPQEELDRAKNIARFYFFDGLESNSKKARFLGKYETLLGSYSNGLSLNQKIHQVTSQQLKDVANRYFLPQRRTVVIGVPK